jgi:hypothetical protein
MIGEVVKALNVALAELPYIDHLGGLVVSAINEKKTYPASCDAAVQCGVEAGFNVYIPDSEKKSVAYWNNGTITFLQILGAKKGAVKFRFSARFCVWLNGRRIHEVEEAGCYLTDAVFAYTASRLIGTHEVSKHGYLRRIEVTGMSLDAKTPSNFGEFTYLKDAIARGVFQPPYDFMTCTVQGVFAIPANCLRELVLSETRPC